MTHLHTIHLIGNAHIDPVWLWRWQEGFAEIKATFRSALDRMNEFPGFTFSCACASYYVWVEENDPAMFAEIKRRVSEGRWVIVGGWWLQPDCNIPCGESFARHGLYSQRYFKDKFGVIARVGYNVDSFGHNGMLPQILKKSGMNAYVFLRPGMEEKSLPGNVFWWESPDGSRVLAFRVTTGYGPWWENAVEGDIEKQKIFEAVRLADQEDVDYMALYGVGNHGGGPTIANLKMILQLQQEHSEMRLVFSSPETYFDSLRKQNPTLPTVNDDLQHHASGCYSAHSETKALNRRAEHRLLTSEKFMTIADKMLGLPYRNDRLQHAWRKVLFNQFHDIMGGCSIKEAYQDSRESFGEACSIGADLLNAATQKLSWNIDTMGKETIPLTKEKHWLWWESGESGVPLVIFNPLSWKVIAPVQVNRIAKGITDENRRGVASQTIRGPQTNHGDKWCSLFMATVPPLGYRVYWIYCDKETPVNGKTGALTAGDCFMENEFVRVEFDTHTGCIQRMNDRVRNLDVFAAPAARALVIDIKECDTWAHRVFRFRNEMGRFGGATITVIEKGPLRARIRVTSRYNDSVLRQDFLLYHDRPDLEARVMLDWREKHAMLKLSFPVNITSPKATYEIPYGFIERPACGDEEPGQQWVDVSGTIAGKGIPYGVALLNDCKYSFDILENDLRMTVANGSIYADHFGERDDLCEYMDQGIQEFRYALVPHQGGWRDTDVDAGVVRKAYEFNVEPVQVIETYHHGTLPLCMEGISIDAKNVIATAFKKAEDGNGYILRCYETQGRAATVKIALPFLKREWSAKFGPCEIKTFRIQAQRENKVVETDLIE